MRLDRSGIEALLPHRGDSLLLAGAVLDGNRGEARAAWDENHPMLPGHFPERRVVPGALLLEAAAQLGGLIVAARVGGRGGRLGVLSAVRKALFHAPVFPGQVVMYEAAARNHGGFVTVTASARHEARKILTCELILTEAPASLAPGA